jgi:hypothetical protein
MSSRSGRSTLRKPKAHQEHEVARSRLEGVLQQLKLEDVWPTQRKSRLELVQLSQQQQKVQTRQGIGGSGR